MPSNKSTIPKSLSPQRSGERKATVKDRLRDPPLLVELEDFVAKELSSVLLHEGNLTPRTSRSHSLPVYRAAFERFIDAFERYSPILTRIKEHYEEAVRDYEHVIGRNLCMQQQLSQLQDDKDRAAGKLERQYRQENKGLRIGLKQQTTLVCQYQASVSILKEELVKVYREREAERQARAQCEKTLKILSKSVRDEQDSIKNLETKVKTIGHENSAYQARLLKTQNKIDPQTYSNAMDSLASALAALEQKTRENAAMSVRVAEMEAIQQKIDLNACSLRPRMIAKPDLKKYEKAARGDGEEYEWVLVPQSKVDEAPWYTDAASREQSRHRHRFIQGIGSTSQAAFLRADTQMKLRNSHLSLTEVSQLVRTLFGVKLRSSPQVLLVDVFWNHVQMQQPDSRAAVQFAYGFLTSVEQYCFEPQIELFRGMMTGELPPSALHSWKSGLNSLIDALNGSSRVAIVDPAVFVDLARAVLQKTEVEADGLVRALSEDRAAAVEGTELNIELLLSDELDLDRPPSALLDALWDQFYATKKQEVQQLFLARTMSNDSTRTKSVFNL